MIYEIRTYHVKPHSLPEVEKRFGEAYEGRKKYSELAAFWHTEIGALNQIIHVWGYKDMAERDKIRAAAVKDGAWPPKIGEFIQTQQSDILHPFAFAPEIKPGKVGPFFEIRTYTYMGGELPVIQKTWEAALPGRLKVSPIVTCGYTDVGAISKFIHIWPYPSLDDRVRIRNELRAGGNWPPSALAEKTGGRGYHLHFQENKIVMPSAFSPLQ